MRSGQQRKKVTIQRLSGGTDDGTGGKTGEGLQTVLETRCTYIRISSLYKLQALQLVGQEAYEIAIRKRNGFTPDYGDINYIDGIKYETKNIATDDLTYHILTIVKTK